MQLGVSENHIELTLADAAATKSFGRTLAQVLQPGTIIALRGGLGAGKTTLVQGIGEGLGVREVINSPTFTTLNEYETGKLPIFHIDLYRLNEDEANPKDVLGPGIAVVLAELDQLQDQGGILIIEWSEYLGDNLPADHILIKLDYAKSKENLSSNFEQDFSGREASVHAYGANSSNLLEQLKRILISC
jgi:tRNA threonylcarbamoyladenosine biosynthesis protein TsaE